MTWQPTDHDLIEQYTVDIVQDIRNWSLHEAKMHQGDSLARIDQRISATRDRERSGNLYDTSLDFEPGIELAELLARRCTLTYRADLLGESIAIYRRLLGNTTLRDMHPMYEDILDGLGDALVQIFAQNIALDNMAEAIALHKKSLQLRHERGLPKSRCLFRLGVAHYIQRTATQAESTRDEYHLAVRYLRESLEILSPSDPERCLYLSFLVIALTEIADPLTPSLSALEAAREAVIHAPLGHPSHVMVAVAAISALTNVKTEYPEPISSRDIQSGVLEGIVYVCELTSHMGHPYAVFARTRLTDRLRVHQDNSPSSCDLVLITALAGDAFKTCSPTSIFRTHIATGLSYWLGYRFVMGDTDALDTKIAVERAFLSDPMFSGRKRSLNLLYNHTMSLFHRFELLGLSEDVDAALSCSDEGIAAITGELNASFFPDLQLGAAIRVARFRRTSDPADLDAALILCRRVIGANTSKLPLRSFWSTAQAFHLKYFQTRDLTLLKECVTLTQEYAERLPGSPHLRFYLAMSLRLLAEHTREPKHAEEALDIMQHIRESTAAANLSYGDYMHELAQDHAALWSLKSDRKHLTRAMEVFGDAVRNYGSPQERFGFALTWTRISRDATPEQREEAFSAAMALLAQVILFGRNLGARLDALKRAPSLARDAAMAALSQGDATRAIQLLEQGRAVFWARALTSKERQADTYGDLGRRFQELQRQIDADDPGDDMFLTRRRMLTEEREALLEQARGTPGLEHVFGALSRAEMQAAAARGAIVVLLADEVASAAVVVRAGAEPEYIPLCGVSTAMLESLGAQVSVDGLMRESDQERRMVKVRRQRGAGYTTVLNSLWSLIVSPVINVLGVEKEGDRPRVFWCPTGPFAFLPLHAAGIFTEEKTEWASDYIVSSYTPSITALLNALKDPPRSPLGANESRILLAAVSDAPAQAALPNTATEVQLVKALAPLSTALEGCISVDTFISALPSASFLHLACHGKQDPLDPLASGFVFHDGMVRLERLMDVDVPRACFAFLSACESAMGDRALPDETIHLAAAMLFLGYRSVIGTLWTMRDEDGPTVARHVYTELLQNREQFDYDAVPRALDAAVRELRESGAHPSRWATWIHIGM